MDSIAPSVSDQMTILSTLVAFSTHSWTTSSRLNPAQADWRGSPNRAPAFTDAEVLTIGLMQGIFGCATLKKAYLLVAFG